MEHVEAASCQNYSMTSQMPLAISYVPMQKFVNVVNAADGFKMGTIFEDLYLNFYCTECKTCGCGQNRSMRRTNTSNMGYMPSNACRNAKNYNTNYGINNNRSTGWNNNCSNDCNHNCTNTGCGNRDYNSGNTGCNNRCHKHSGCRMNNCNCPS